MATDGQYPALSLVIPFFNEEASLPLLRDRMLQLQGLPENREIVFVSDGSTDRSVAIVEEWAAADERVRLLILTRNFGHQPAICAGLDAARGDWVAIMDADLQDLPEVMLQMYETAREGGWDIVFNTRVERSGSILKQFAYRMFYKGYSALADSPVDSHSGDFAVLSRRAADALVALPEKIRFVRGLRAWLGLRSKAFASPRPMRAAGRPQYTLPKLVGLALNGLTSFSIRPLRIATIGGLILCLLALCLALAYIVLLVVYDLHDALPGFTTIVVLILFLSGVQFMLMGLIGEYIGQIFLEVKRRPTYVIDRAVNLPRDRPSPARPV